MEIKFRPNHLVYIGGGALHLPLLISFANLKHHFDSMIISLVIFFTLVISIFINNESKILIENPFEKTTEFITITSLSIRKDSRKKILLVSLFYSLLLLLCLFQ